MQTVCSKDSKTPEEPEKFWYAASLEKCGDEARFPNLSKLMMNLMSLPHSSAAAERIFFPRYKQKQRTDHD